MTASVELSIDVVGCESAVALGTKVAEIAFALKGADMPHYYFHTTGALAHNDDEGIELSDGHAAREQALVSAGEILKEVAATKDDNFELSVDVIDSDQRRIYSVRVVAGISDL